MKNKWYGTPPKYCEVCHGKLTTAFVDSRMTTGRWAIMCVVCHYKLGVGLGVGKGQKYTMKVIKGGGTEWIKVKKSK